VDGRTYEQPLEVRADPRVLESGVTVADMAAQLELGKQVAALLTRANLLAARLDDAKERLRGDEAALERVAAIERELLTDSSISSYPQPMLQAQIGYLYSMLTRADQRPGRDAYERFGELSERLAELEARAAGAGI